MGVADDAAKGAAAGSFLGMPGAVAGAAVGGVFSLLGANKGSKSAKSAQSAQERMAREALAEQKRIYDLEAQKEAEQRAYDRAQAEEAKGYDRAQTERVYGSRRNAFGGFDADLDRFSQGYAPAYGMSQEATDATMERRNGGGSRSQTGPIQPNLGDKGLGAPSAAVGAPGGGPWMPKPVSGAGFPGQMQGPTGAGAMGATVWMQAPTGETMEVPITDAPMLLEKGAVLIPAPGGQS